MATSPPRAPWPTSHTALTHTCPTGRLSVPPPQTRGQVVPLPGALWPLCIAGSNSSSSRRPQRRLMPSGCPSCPPTETQTPQNKPCLPLSLPPTALLLAPRPGWRGGGACPGRPPLHSHDMSWMMEVKTNLSPCRRRKSWSRKTRKETQQRVVDRIMLACTACSVENSAGRGRAWG